MGYIVKTTTGPFLISKAPISARGIISKYGSDAQLYLGVHPGGIKNGILGAGGYPSRASMEDEYSPFTLLSGSEFNFVTKDGQLIITPSIDFNLGTLSLVSKLNDVQQAVVNFPTLSGGILFSFLTYLTKTLLLGNNPVLSEEDGKKYVQFTELGVASAFQYWYRVNYNSDTYNDCVAYVVSDAVGMQEQIKNQFLNFSNVTSAEVEIIPEWTGQIQYNYIGNLIPNGATFEIEDRIPELIVTADKTDINAGDSVTITAKVKFSDEEEYPVDVSQLTTNSGFGSYSNGTFKFNEKVPNVATVFFSYSVIPEAKASITFTISGGYDASNPYTPSIGTGGSGTGGFPSIPGGGGGNFGVVNGTPESSDPIAPSLPPSGSYESGYADSGLFTLYALNSAKLKTVGEWLWTSDLGVRVMRELLSIVYASPIESAISLISYPFDIPSLNGVNSVNKPLYWGSQQMSDTIGVISAPALLNPYATIDWGTIQLNEFWGNFLDYAPHTKLELYLPWCTGFVPIDPNECLPGTIRVVTNIELAKGTCLHNVIGNDGRVIATHAGTCGKQLPLTALDTSGKALAFVTAAVSAATVVGGTMAGAAAGAMTPGEPIVLNSTWRPGHQRFIDPGFMPNMSDVGKGAMSGARKSGSAVKKPAVLAASVGLKGHVQISRNGSFNGSSAGLGVQFPYLIISRPTQSVPAQYGHHYGYPSNIYTPLANLRGYTEVGEIHLTGFVCTEEELEEIDSILKGGVIL